MEAYLYEKMEDQKVRCHLCSHRCAIRPGKRGICNVRENRDGVLHTLVYEKLIARHVDPIEKKPLFHMMPGSLSYSVATVGCNFRCRFCQNADIAQMPSDYGNIMGKTVTPEAVVADALKENCRSIAYTYTEPTVYFEFAFETAKRAHEKGLKNVFVSNGYMTPEALKMIRPYLDGANIDLKAFTDEFYRKQCGARLEPVKATLKGMRAAGIFIEVTTLIIPGLNDDPEELTQLAGFIASELGTETPWHISRFHPTYKMTDRPVTPLETLMAASEIGKAAGLKYVYMGNVPGQGGENTICHQCGETVIERLGFQVRANRLKDGRCPDCGAEIHGIGL
ncbi:AmmeMemoRadiSam system radical SAM enzyme [Desulfonema ishimotonii]|uniref:AmmeMemoRadiSam system radical SAM enzyme n=1 Tax=Desulfonema ishimotonii TaxID=45657 RepID=A0A401G249_9BACT|nr:AmmeMemoRadiSam system radical SAM enzyme [Desulfonema ishimotonii]GBC63312.1 AmmeMemoRadiSam system radical SAM enzyme [Desulfonema ishimotonii]